MTSRSRRITLIGALLLVLFGIYTLSNVTAASAQAFDPEVVVTAPAQLERLSWGAILAGSILAIIIMLGLNLLGISIGMTNINPEYGEDSAEPKALATGAAVWIGVSTLISLFIGGWVAARFAGIPDNVDGLLHGLVTWAVVMLITLFLLTTSVGRILSGVGTLISHGLHLAGQTAGAVAQGVANVAQGAAHGIANVAQTAASGAANAADNALDQSPEVANALQRFNASRNQIGQEANDLLRRSGVDPQQVKDTAQNAAQEVQSAVKQAAQDPAHADKIFSDTLQRILQQGQDVVNQADRDTILHVIQERAGVSEQEARQTLERWEGTANTARQQVEEARRQATQQLQQAQRNVRAKAEEVRDDAERTAREAAAATTKAISRIAAVVFAALLVGAIAGGVGGLIGAPEVLPVAEVDDFRSDNDMDTTNVTPIFTSTPAVINTPAGVSTISPDQVTPGS